MSWKVIRAPYGRMAVVNGSEPVDRPILAEFSSHDEAFDYMDQRERKEFAKREAIRTVVICVGLFLYAWAMLRMEVVL